MWVAARGGKTSWGVRELRCFTIKEGEHRPRKRKVAQGGSAVRLKGRASREKHELPRRAGA